MSTKLLLVLTVFISSCQQSPQSTTEIIIVPNASFTTQTFKQNTWQHFLQALPAKPGTVVDFTGSAVENQSKHIAVLPYDVGKQDLQQCADALIRLRAEYLFTQQRFDEIKFRFTSGHLYSWSDYRQGKRPKVRGPKVTFEHNAPPSTQYTYKSLRAYLDIVYAYAGTQSLAFELQQTDSLEVGTVIIQPGSPGHCCMIMDEAVDNIGRPVYKLVEGYTPAQSIYILKNPVDGSPWHTLKEGYPIKTASYKFTDYRLCRFE
jgi:hypothetical protein